MHRSPLEDLRHIEGADCDPGLVSATLVKLIYSSREFEAKIYDSDPRNGTYVVVLEGVLEVNERETAPPEALSDRPVAPAVTAPVQGDAGQPGAPSESAHPTIHRLRGGNEPSTGG